MDCFKTTKKINLLKKKMMVVRVLVYFHLMVAVVEVHVEEVLVLDE
jgi:hypothetical protein